MHGHVKTARALIKKSEKRKRRGGGKGKGKGRDIDRSESVGRGALARLGEYYSTFKIVC